MLSTIRNIDCNFVEVADSVLTGTSFCCKSIKLKVQHSNFNANIDYTISTERFEEPLFSLKTSTETFKKVEYFLFVISLSA